MKARWISAALLLVSGIGWADYKEDLAFAGKLGGRGLRGMAYELLDKLEKSSDPAAARAGRYGKAQLDQQRASIAKARFLRALEEGKTPTVSRDEVLEIYKEAKPKIEDYVNNRKEDLDARFLLAQLLQEYAQFLVGADYPEELKEEREKLVGENAGDAEKLFEAAIGHYDAVAKQMAAALEQLKDYEIDDPRYVRLSNALYNKAHARLRWALLYPTGSKFNFRSEEAIEELDDFFAEHYEDIFGAYAQLDLGVCYLERGLRIGSADDAETAINYFNSLYTTVKEKPDVPETTEVIAKAFYWYAKACNALARGEQKLKAQPVYFENTIRSGTELRQRLKHGYKHPFALKAMLLVAEAFAAQNRFNEAVALAGDTLTTARVESHRQIANQATAKLTAWVARVTGAGALDPALLSQIGASLASQGRSGSAITFLEKAMAAAETDEDKEDYAYPALVRIAGIYRRDKRYYAGERIAWRVVEDYLKSGQEEDSGFGQIASEACYTAQLCWKQIAEATNRAKDQAAYQKALGVFREKFPGHPANGDAAFTEARELYSKKKYEQAAQALRAIGPTSRNYWLAQRLVPAAFRKLATGEKEPAKAKLWHEKTLAAGRDLVKLADAKRGDETAARARRTGHLFVAMALASLERWPEALKSIDDYLRRYPGPLKQRGLEYLIKINAHLALGQLDEAETALAALEKRVGGNSAILRSSIYTVFGALRKACLEASSRPQKVALAGRASLLLEKWMAFQKQKDYKLWFFYGEVLKDAERFDAASRAYTQSAAMAPDVKLRQGLTQRAAEARYRALRTDKGLSRKEKIEKLKETRDLFTDVLIPPDSKDPKKTAQRKVLKALGNPQQWPSRDIFSKVKRNARALAIAADIYSNSSPAGIDGRYVALRLIHHLHSFTKPVEDESKPQLKEFIPLWWDAAELKLKVYLAIAQSGAGAREKTKAKEGYAFARKLLFEYEKMDGPARVNAVKALEAQLKVAAR